jgi:NhaA family Na+:H+ antiporter
VQPTSERATWLRSDRFLARSVAQPINRFLHVEASGGVLLVAAAIVALVWANSPWSASYESLWSTELTLGLGDHAITEDLRHWVNDGLMTLFFFVIGLEIKQELANGQLTTLRRAAIPAAGAVGGMAVPALLYIAFNAGGAGGDGWGIPMATDVAFALGVLALLGSRVPAELKVLLLGLAIVDDIGAIVVIAAFYSDGIDWQWAATALAGLGLVVALKRVKVRYIPVYAVLGAGIWFATFESGIHATIAGVALGLLAPARPFLRQPDADRLADEPRAPPRAHPGARELLSPTIGSIDGPAAVGRGRGLGHVDHVGSEVERGDPPALPTRSAVRRAMMPVPQATSRTRPPGCRSAAATRLADTGVAMEGTKWRW